MELHEANYRMAVADFKRARRQAALQQLLGRLTGQTADLLAYEEISDLVLPDSTVGRGVQEIALDKIVGSVGRYDDFTRDFLPKKDSNESRWAGVKAAVLDMSGMPPIDVYQVGDYYFVRDGNHRVSVARQLGTESISANVTEVKTRVPFTLGEDHDQFIVNAQYANFLEQTDLLSLRPKANLRMTVAGHYRDFLAQIEQHWARLKQQNETFTYADAVSSWYDDVYLPVVRLIRQQGILRNFPERTEADIYELFVDHQEEVEAALGWEVDVETAVSSLQEELEEEKRPLWSRMVQALLPNELKDGPEPGKWRKQQLALHGEKRMFSNLLVSVTGSNADWHMLEQMIQFAQFDHDRLLGIYDVASEAERHSPKTKKIEAEFLRRCSKAKLPVEFAVEVGPMPKVLVKRAAWADLVAVSIDEVSPFPEQPRVHPDLTLLIQQCPRPIFAMPERSPIRPLRRLLLGYDGSPKSQEALFLAAYFVLRWGMSLYVLTVETSHTSLDELKEAKAYLGSRGIEAEYMLGKRPIAETMMKTAVSQNCDAIIIGGYGRNPLRHLMVGSAINDLLGNARCPVIICR